MATPKQKAKVGLFLVICMLLIAGGILLISGYRHEPKVHYWTEFHESVLGLSTGSVVTYLGVPVGSVSNIVVTDNYTARAELEILVNKVTLRPGVEARLMVYSFAAGTLSVGLSGGDPQAPMLPPGSEIPSTPSLVEAVSSRIEDLLDNLNEIAAKVSNALEGLEEGQVRDLVQNASDLLYKAQEFTDKANELLDTLGTDADSGLSGFQDLLKDIKKLVDTTNSTVESLKGQIEALNLGKTNETLDTALGNISNLAESLQSTAEAIENVGSGASHSINDIQLNLRETMRVLNESLNSIRDLADYLLQDPSALIRGKGRPRGE